MTNEVDLLRRMSAARPPYTRADWYVGMRLDPKVNSVISERDDKLHNALRAKLSFGYSGKDLPGLEESIDDRCEDFVNLIQHKYLSSDTTVRPLDFAQAAQYFAMDVLTNVAFGETFGYLVNDADVYGYIKTIRAFMPILELQVNKKTFNKIMTSWIVQALLAPTAEDRVGMGKVIGVAQSVVRERYAESESLLQIMAGADSTATAVRSTFLHIITNPRTYTTLRAEIGSFIEPGRISSPVLRDAEARVMPYLQACIEEGLRIWPPLSGLMTKLVPHGGDTFNDMFFPGGNEIAYSAWGVHYDKRVYGEDAEIYRPERWFASRTAPEKLATMARSIELVFGSGRYRCLGKSVAFVELDKVSVQLLRQFEFTINNPFVPIKSFCNRAHMQNRMFVRVTEREPKA